MSRLGSWGKRLLSPGQETEAVEAQPPAIKAEEAARGHEREQTPGAGATGSARRVAPARLGPPARSQRSYLTEPLTDTVPRRAERGSVGMTQAPGDGADALAAQRARGVPEEQVAGPARQQSAEGEPPAGSTPEQAEEMRRALTRKLLKGSRNGMLLTLEPGYVWSQVLGVLEARLVEAPTFFQGSVLSLDTRRRPLEPQEIDALRALLAPYEMAFKEVGSDELNDPRILPSGAVRPAYSGDTTPTLAIRASDATNALFTRRTIRSGQRLRYEGSVVVMGDVNAGAEVIAGGDVLVWGALRGTVHAGYPGNEAAVVCALMLAPVQLRIGALASRPPEDGDLAPLTPEVASVKNGQIVVESWNAGRASRR
jgi:septum site-determining protein MinC